VNVYNCVSTSFFVDKYYRFWYLSGTFVIFEWSDYLTISDSFSVSDLVFENIDNTGNILQPYWDGNVLSFENIEIPSCAGWNNGVIQFYSKLPNTYPAGVTVGVKSTVYSGTDEIVSDSVERQTTVPEFDFNLTIDPAGRKVVAGAPVKVTFDLTTNTYRAISISDDLFDDNGDIDLNVNGLVCSEDIQQILPAQDAWQLKPSQTLTCTYDWVVNNNTFGVINLDHRLLKDLEDPKIGDVLASMHEQLEWIANIDAVGELVSWNPHAYGDLVQYKMTLTNNGSATADGYRVYMDFPVDYLDIDTVRVTLPGSSNPLLLNQEWGTNNYYVEAGLPSIPVGATREILVSAELKDGADHNTFTNELWLENLPQYVQNNNNPQDFVSIDAKYLEINFVWYMTPATQYAISGTEVSFDIFLANNGDLGCTGSIDYILPNNQLEFVSASDSHFSTDVHYKTDIWVPAHTVDNNVTINAQVIDPDGAWLDDSLFVTLNGTYDCGVGVETFTDQIEIEPIPYINVEKTLTSVIPSSVGDVVEYTVVVKNDGSKLAEINRLYDLFPWDDLQLKTTSWGQPNQDWVEYYRDYNMANLIIPAGGEIELVLQGTLLDDTLWNSFDNVARVEMMGAVRPDSVLIDTETVTVEHRNIDVSLTADEDPLYAISGTDLNFDIVLTNNGSTVCSGTTSYHYSLPNSVSVGDNPLQENMLADFSLNPGWHVDFSDIDGQVVIPFWADDSFYIEVTTDYTCAGVGPERVITQLEIQPVADLVVTKELLSGNPRIDNDLVQYRIVLENRWSAIAEWYALYDDFPVVLTYRDSRFDGVSYLPSLVSTPPLPGSEYMRSGDFLDIAPETSVEVILEWNLKAWYCYDRSVENNVRVELDPQYSFLNDMSGVTGFVQSPDMFVDVVAIGSDPENLDDPVVFEISYTNSGNMTATGVVIRGNADLGMYDFVSNVGMSPQPVETSDGREIVWPFDLAGNDVEVGDSGVITLTWYLDSDTYLPTTPLCLNVEITTFGWENLCGNYNNNFANVCHQVTWEIADLLIEKSVVDTDLGMVEIDDVITYRLDIVNTWNDSATDISLLDVLPFGISYVGYSSPMGSISCVYDEVSREFSCDWINLWEAWAIDDSTYVLLEVSLDALPLNGIYLTNTGSVIYPWREFNMENNQDVLTIFVPGLADISVTKTVSDNIVAVEWDLVEYDVTYSNIGWRTGYDILVYDSFLFDGLDYYSANPQNVIYRDENTRSGYRGGGDLWPGQSRNIHIVARLNDYYEAGTLLPNRAEVVMSWTEQTLVNNIAYATWIITSVQDLSVNIVGTNLSHPNNDEPVWAVSGDIVQFEITYFNSGNVNIENALLTFDVEHLIGYPVQWLENIAPFVLVNLHYGSGGTIVLTWIVGPQWYQNIWGVVNIYESSSALAPASSDRDEIVEPLECGDGFLTWDEQCDIGTGFGVIWDILPGQVCSIQQNNPSLGCALNTEFVPNTGCVDFTYTVGGNIHTGQNCSYIEPVWVDDAFCEELTYHVVQVDVDKFDYDFVCYGENTDENTYIKMDCGNGDYFETYGDVLDWTCHYTWTVWESITYLWQCMVGEDIDNPDCEMPVDFEIEEPELVCELDVEHSVLIMDYDDGQYEKWVDVTCGTESGEPAEILAIDCGNGEIYESENDNEFTRECRYEVDEDYIDDFPMEYDIQCIVNENENDACEETIISDIANFPVCGNGILEWPYEECDLGYDDEEIEKYLDLERDYRAKNRDIGNMCEDCRIRDKEHNFVYQPPACFNTEVNISVQKWEILPFRWNIDRIGADFVDDEDSCNEDNQDHIIENSLICHFAIYDYNKHSQKDLDPVYEFERDCFDNDVWTKKINDYIEELMKIKPSRKSWKYFIENFGLEDSDDGFNRDFNNGWIDSFGEYKLVLEEVEYKLCNEDVEPIIYPRVCEVDFAVTNPYLIQINAFGATKVASSEFDIGLDDFYAYNSENRESILSRTDIRDIMEIESADYKWWASFKRMVDDFVSQQERLAILVSEDVEIDDASIKVKKVNWQQIYLMEWDWETITVKEMNSFDKSFTIITRWLNVVIEWSLSENVNGMFLVTEKDGKWGEITFDYENDEDCNEVQVVNGIFYAENWFGLESDAVTLNDDEDDQRCVNGTLHVKGILIWDGIEKLVKKRRSHLNDWFFITGDWWDEDNVRAQRREEIFAWASVLIEYDPSLWEGRLPPGAESFTKELDVYKR